MYRIFVSSIFLTKRSLEDLFVSNIS